MGKKEKLPELLTDERVKFFENEQKEYGTKTAINNVIWQVAADILRSIGIDKIKTE